MSLTKVTYSMIESAPVSVDDFGAVGDNTTDDGPAIQLAVTYANTYGGKVVFSPFKTYYVATEVIIQVTSIISGYNNRRIFEIDGQGAYIRPGMADAGSVFKINGAAVDYQSMVSIHDFVVTSNNTSGATNTPFQAIAFVNAEGGGYQNLQIYNIKSDNIVAMATVVWFSEINTGFMDGVSVHDINFSYAVQTGSVIVMTKKSSLTYGSTGQVRFYNLWITTSNRAIDWYSWVPGPVTRGNGSQACIYIDNVQLEQAHIGPWVGGNPFSIYGANNALFLNSTIEGVYSELYQAASVYGSGQPIAIAIDLRDCVVTCCRQYWDRVSFAGSARLYRGKAINCKFEKPAISVQGTAPVSTDNFIYLNTGSFGNTFDTFYISSSDPSSVDTYYVHPSQHITAQTASEKQNNAYRSFRAATPIQFSVPSGQTWSAAASRLLATIPAYFLNTNTTIEVSVFVRTTASGAGAVLNLGNLINAAGGNTGNITLDSTNPEAELKFRIQFTGGTDKTYTPTASYYFAGYALQKGGTIMTGSNSGSAFSAVNVVNNDMGIWLNVSSLSDGVVEFVDGRVQVIENMF